MARHYGEKQVERWFKSVEGRQVVCAVYVVLNDGEFRGRCEELGVLVSANSCQVARLELELEVVKKVSVVWTDMLEVQTGYNSAKLECADRHNSTDYCMFFVRVLRLQTGVRPNGTTCYRYRSDYRDEAEWSVLEGAPLQGLVPREKVRRGEPDLPPRSVAIITDTDENRQRLAAIADALAGVAVRLQELLGPQQLQATMARALVGASLVPALTEKRKK